MEIDSYTDLEPLPGRPTFYFGRETRFASDETLLIKVYDQKIDAAAPQAWQVEARLLSWLQWPTLRLVNAGRDSKRGQDYCCMIVPGRFVPLSFEGCDASHRISLLRAAARAIEALNDRGVAYRNFTPSAFGRLDNSILLYDFSRATRYGPDGTAQRPPSVEEFDPPEATHGAYNAVSGEVYGLGCLFRSAAMNNTDMSRLVGRMTSTTPEQRYSTIGDVVRELEQMVPQAGT